MKNKKALPFIIIGVSVGIFTSAVLLRTSQAQVVVSNAPTGGGECSIGKSGSGSTAETVYGITSPDGKIYAISGQYNMNVECNGYTSVCGQLTSAVNTATAQGNSMGSGFPQMTTNLVGNNVTVYIVSNNNICGYRSDGKTALGGCEISTASTEVDGSQQVSASIYLNMSSPETQPNLLSNTSYTLSFVEHEMSHGFGIDDTYKVNPDDPGLMAAGEFNDATWANDPTLTESIKNIDLGIQNGSSIATFSGCDNQCGNENEIPVLTDASDPTGSYTCEQATPSCNLIDQDDSGNILCSMPNDVVCNCNNPSAPSCANNEENVSVTPPVGACMVNGTLLPPDTYGSDTITQDEGLLQNNDSTIDTSDEGNGGSITGGDGDGIDSGGGTVGGDVGGGGADSGNGGNDQGDKDD